MPTLNIDNLEPSGFVVPPGWYGFIQASGVGIVRRAIVNDEEGKEALRRLAAPEGESRSQEFEGRRMVRVNGGYVVLNFQKFRDRDYSAANRMKRYRDKLAAGHTPVTRNSRNVTRNVTQAEAEGEAKGEASQTNEPPSAPRKRDPLKDAIAAIGGSDPLQTPKGRWSAIQKVLTDILSVTPDLSPSEIHRRETNYRLHYPNVACTPEALAKWWALCEHPPGLAGRPKRSPEEIAEEQERLAKAFPAV